MTAPASSLPAFVSRFRWRPEWTRRFQGWPAWFALGVVAYIFFLYVAFPYESLGERLASEAARAGISLRIGKLGPAVLGIRAREVSLGPLSHDAAAPAETVRVDSVTLRPSLLPRGVAFSVRALGGTLSGVWAVSNSRTHLRADWEDLDPSLGNFAGFSGVALSGKVSGDVLLNVPPREGSQTGPRSPDFAAAEGHLNLHAQNFNVLGGRLSVPLYGQSMPLDLPKLGLGNIDIALKAEKGEAAIERLEAKGGEAELLGEGKLRLRQPPMQSELDTQLSLKVDSAAVSRLGLLGGGLSILSEDRKNRGFRAAKLTGRLARPQFMPGR
ncbi:MAG: type II secretion system protein GspN [Myxococcaceae bacterium]